VRCVCEQVIHARAVDRTALTHLEPSLGQLLHFGPTLVADERSA
jgi:hypothetical protein